MRRIIERVVTVVTTTTWKISWDTDLHSAQPNVDPVSEELPHLETRGEFSATGPTVIEAKEVNPPGTENVQNPPAEGLPDDSNSYLFKKGNKKS